MSELARWGLIGPGNVGGELARQLNQEHVAARLGMHQLPDFVVRSSAIMGSDGVTPNGLSSLEEVQDLPDVTFIAMPSTDDGEVAKGYIDTILEQGKIAITAEKGALANNFEELRAASGDFASLGINATVGGGTRLIEVLKQYSQDPSNITQLHLALNGTLSAIMSSVGPHQGNGMSLGQAVHEAVQLGYAEPGAETPSDVIKGEAEGDIPKKTSILFNALGLSEEILSMQELKFSLEPDQLLQVLEEARVRRFLVSIYSAGHTPERDIIGGFDIEHAGWRIVSGFRNIERNPLFSHFASMNGPANGYVIGLGPDETDGVYRGSGPGAGIRPTANTMIDDYVTRANAPK